MHNPFRRRTGGVLVGEHMFRPTAAATSSAVPIPYSTFRAALDAGNLERVIMLAREMPPMGLEDALRVVLLMRDGDEQRYDRAACRWIGRFALEANHITIEDLRAAVTALDILPDHPEAAMTQLQSLCVEHGVG